MRSIIRTTITLCAATLLAGVILAPQAGAAVMNDYVCSPPFVSKPVPPLVMFEVGRDHKLYYQAYNEAVDLDGDGQIDYNYKHSINYFGYFDPYKCYTHTGGLTGNSGNTAEFTPVSFSASKFCRASQWSGNVLNWLTMSRMDELRKVLYGGSRSTDSNTKTVLKRSYVPQDAHSWGKELTGRLCYNGADGTYNYTCVTDADCASGQSCLDKSVNLIGFAAADAPGECPSSVSAPTWNATNKTVSNTTGNILIVKYNHPTFSGTATENGDYTVNTLPPPADCPSCADQITITDDVYNSFEPSAATLLNYFYISSFNYADPTAGCGTACKDVLPNKDHGDHHNFLAISEFNVTNAQRGDWQFFIDSDDGAEVLVAPSSTPSTPLTLVARHQIYDAAGSTADTQHWLGAHSSCATAPTTECDPAQIGTINIGTSGYWRLVVRHTESAGQDGVRVWYRRGTSGSWRMFGESGQGAPSSGTAWLASDLTLRAPAMTAANTCSLYSPVVVDYGAPVVGTAKRHLFCNTTLSDGGVPIMRLLKNKTNRMWEWAAKEKPVCDESLGTPIDFTVAVEVCKSSVGAMSESYEYERCKNYAGTYKPIGLIQKFGEQAGSTKVCSKQLSKACASDAGCNLATEGLCIYKSDMYFGLFTTGYDKNKSGGVLHKNFGSILDETNANNGLFQTSENVSGNIMITMDKMKVIDYSYSNRSYGTNSNACGWITGRPINEGECRDWGNPIAEMMYDSVRYIAGKTTPTAAFTNGNLTDAGLLKQPDWGKFGTGSATYKPYDVYPACAKPFILLLSDVNTAYDSDQVPGSSFASYSEDAGLPLLNMNVTTLANTIGTAEGIPGNSWFIGQSTSENNFMCTAKPGTGFSSFNLSEIRGICPEEPTKQGSFYTAAVAYYGKTQFKTNTTLPNIDTFAVALASPFNDLKIKVGSRFVTVVPAGKSVSGCLGTKTACADKCTLTSTANGMTITNCTNTGYCPSNTIVNVYVENIKYDGSNNVIYAKFRINYEDVEQGADHDMDAIVSYEICTDASEGMSGTSCTTTLAADQLEVKLNSVSAAGCLDQIMGFIINGTTADGSYLVVKDADVGTGDGDTPAVVGGMPLSWQKTFTVSSTGSTAGLLKNPLWYAAKWGGFQDKNGNNIPDLAAEWNKNGDGDPDNYFMVVNPLQLERQLDRALTEIMKRVSSGTAASILNNSEGSGANLLQAVFYPKKSFDNGTEVDWTGEMQNLWYYVDPFFNRSTVRVDTNSDYQLDLKQDWIAKFRFDAAQGQTFVDLIQDVNGDGSVLGTPVTLPSDDPGVKSLWRAGRKLWERNLTSDPRKIYTITNPAAGSTLTLMENNGTFNNNATVISLMQATDGTVAGSYIDYLHGFDQPSLGYRSRTVNIIGCGLTDTQGCYREWKLGDIVNSTPRLESSFRLNTYNLEPPSGYGDSSYAAFTKSNNYKHRGMAFAGGNDGMLHAFRLGVLDVSGTTKTHKANMKEQDGVTPASSTSNLGREEWAFVPRNSLPYLKYMTAQDYGHIYYIDNTVNIFDASIAVPGNNDGANFPTCSAANYYMCEKKTTPTTGIGNLDMANTSWRTILVGGMGYGGASRNSTTPSLAGGGCDDKIAAGTCVKTPIVDVGYSSYFALDVTNPHVLPGTDAANDVKFLWEFNGDPANNNFLGYSTSGPAIVRVGQTNANGRWFAVFVSGPTGPIDTINHQFLGAADQKLKIFIVDLATGQLLRTIDAGLAPYNITNAFGGSISGAVSDNDKWDRSSGGFYKDDVIYIGYVQKDTTVTPNTWTKGGVLRLLTKESTDPANWALSKLIDNIGPVTTAVTKLQDRFAFYDKGVATAATGKLWLYFGTGRYFHREDALDNQFRAFGIEEPCYSNNTGAPNFTSVGPAKEFDQNCTKTVVIGDLQQQNGNATTSALQVLPVTKRGWYIDLDTTALNDGYKSERVITNPVASTAGAVFFTTFRPTADICGYGGNSFVWSLKHDSGGAPPAAAMQGKAIMQVSTGALAEISLATAFKSTTNNKRYDMRRLDQPISGMPPTANGLALLTNPKPVKKMMHYQEN